MDARQSAALAPALDRLGVHLEDLRHVLGLAYAGKTSVPNARTPGSTCSPSPGNAGRNSRMLSGVPHRSLMSERMRSLRRRRASARRKLRLCWPTIPTSQPPTGTVRRTDSAAAGMPRGAPPSSRTGSRFESCLRLPKVRSAPGGRTGSLVRRPTALPGPGPGELPCDAGSRWVSSAGPTLRLHTHRFARRAAHSIRAVLLIAH